ncbi:MAG: family 20 glycosylhydrolase [Acidobacteria bacterium]|nr:family 20 glycosylhydrolase [Acidobacteriota bacterium]MBI3424861.1 family 20 glycosylhydrolase [Acidobacteriota bacterium]
MKTVALLVTLLGLSVSSFAQSVNPPHNLMPVPAALKFQPGRLPVTEQFTVAVRGHSDARLQAALARMMARLGARTGFTFTRGLASDADKASLMIACQGPGKAIPAVDEDETYTLEINDRQATLSAPTVVGVLRGLETILQLLNGDKDGHFLPAVSIQDKPRFPWRGLMIDIARHWQPMEVIKRNLDGMAAVKLNVLHLHITDDQGFRIESKPYPELQQRGSDGDFYTQDQMREIIEYARQRGIRVIPEFDMPGHTTAWFVSHPELASKPGPYEIERTWGIMQPVMDPTNEKLYELLDGFLGEMAALFPDAYLHIGGDEIEGLHWKENAKIQAFIQTKGLKDNHGLQAYFNQRVAQILTKHGKRVIGWDEVVHPDIPKNIVVQSWRGPESLAAAARQGYSGILSNGYYIDLMYPARDHYLNDPIPADTPLSINEQKLILGGEATMWSEWVSPETIDSRIWPRTAAIAERLWSPREVRDVADMYRRLAVMSKQLEAVGLQHLTYQTAMWRRALGAENDRATEFYSALEILTGLVEPVKGYRRGTMQQATQSMPLTRLVDMARPDSHSARAWAHEFDNFLYDILPLEKENLPAHQRAFLDQAFSTRTVTQSKNYDDWVKTLTDEMRRWRDLKPTFEEIGVRIPLLQEAKPLASDLSAIGKIGSQAMFYLVSGTLPSVEWRVIMLSRLDQAALPKAALELVAVQPIRELVIAACEWPNLKTMTAEEWKRHVKTLAAPKKQ